MSAFFSYIQNITYYLLFAAIAGMVAPAGKYKKFVQLVLGLVLLVVVLAPLARFGSGGAGVIDWFSQWEVPTFGATPAGQADIYAQWHNTHVQAAFEAQLHQQLETFLAQHDVVLHGARFGVAQDFSRIETLDVTVSRAEAAPARVPFIRIEPVQPVQILPFGPRNAAPPPPTPCALTTDVKNWLAHFYAMPLTHIHVTVINT